MRRLALLFACAAVVRSVPPIPPSLDAVGFELGTRAAPLGKRIEMFGDFQCPDTKAAWINVIEPFVRAHGDQVSVVFHPFPLPYHKNGFDSAQAVVVIGEAGGGGGMWSNVMDALFAAQDKFQTDATFNMSQAQVFSTIFSPVAVSLGLTSSDFLAHMTNEDPTNGWVRGAWKFGAARGVSGTPTFAANGVISDALGSWTLAQWEEWAVPK